MNDPIPIFECELVEQIILPFFLSKIEYMPVSYELVPRPILATLAKIWVFIQCETSMIVMFFVFLLNTSTPMLPSLFVSTTKTHFPSTSFAHKSKEKGNHVPSVLPKGVV